ncbi:hypothetical protein KC730_03435, partial [Candidatus Kaiserbacteria bacterium]|nr:hypothetical protein [Candidatus Kaiserbacteria bacterium]
MNILTYTQRNLSAKFFAAITIVSMILSAFPVAFFVADAATIDFTVYAVPDPVGTDGDGEYVTISFIDTVDFAGWKLVDNNGDETDLTSLGIVSGPDDLQICSNMVFSTNGGVNCDLTFGTNFNLVNTAGQVQLVSPDPSVVVDLTWASVTVGQTVSDSGQYIEPSVACTPQHDAAGVTNIQNTSTGDYFDSIEDALADCDTSDGDIVELLGDITTTKQQRIARPIILDGNGYTIDAAFAKNGNDNNSAINVFGTSDVTVMDIVLDGTSGTELHGLNVYRSDDVVVSNLEAKNFRTGLLVNGSVVAASDITTSGNTWHAINVDKGSDDYPATLIISNTSSHAENSATPPSGHIPGVNKPHIYVDNANGFNTVIDDDSQYDIHEFFIPTVPAVQTQQFAVAIQVPGIKPQVYTLKSVTPEPVANIHTSKIVCTDEADLPNWVSAPSTITETTATDWLAEHKDSSCSLVRGWEFEWAPKGTSDPGDTLVGTAGPDWTTFTGSTQVPESAFDGGSFWVREVLQADYIPFTHESEGDKNTDDVTAEMYCHTDGLNYDNYDRIDDPEVGGDYYCVAWNVPVEKTSDVTICKYDQSEESLEGWQLALLGAEVDSLSVKPDGTTQSMLNVPAGFYVLKADGAYEYRGNTGLLADARFSERQAGDPDFGTYPYQPWREASAGTGGLAVQVNGDLGVSWGSTFSPSHVYYGALSQASLDDVDFYVYDNAYNDNVGEIDVTLYHGYTGITEEDGCVTFEDVPYGEYEVEELLQLDWTNLSGLGPVVVDEESEVFEVVNQDPNQEPVTCTLKLTSDDTNTVDEKGGAFAKVLSFIHNNWTTTLNDADWIWGDDGPVNPSQEETQTFSNKFGWSGATVVSATLSIAADNSFSATLDGDLAGEDLGEFNLGATKDYDGA